MTDPGCLCHVTYIRLICLYASECDRQSINPNVSFSFLGNGRRSSVNTCGVDSIRKTRTMQGQPIPLELQNGACFQSHFFPSTTHCFLKVHFTTKLGLERRTNQSFHPIIIPPRVVQSQPETQIDPITTE